MGNIHALNCCTNPDDSAGRDNIDELDNNPTSTEPFQSVRHPMTLTAARSEFPSSSSAVQPPVSEILQLPMRNVEVGNENLSTGYSSEEVFLSHSGKQKDFAEWLWLELQKEGITCFFDKHSLLKGEEFPRRIFDAANRCKVAVVVLSQDFITSRWPMQELCAFDDAKKTTNPNLRIFPLFFKMTPEQLRQRIQGIRRGVIPKDWEYIMNSKREPIRSTACVKILNDLRILNGAVYHEKLGVYPYIGLIVKDIRNILPRHVEYEDPFVRGRERLCQEVANLFRRAPDMNGVKVAGLYGIYGSGKTTMCMSLCNFYSQRFGLRAFHAEFQSGGLPINVLKNLVMFLTGTAEAAVQFVNGYQEAVDILNRGICSQKVFLALDNIPDRLRCFREVKAYLNVRFAKGSLILLTAGTRGVLNNIIPQGNRDPFMHVPTLKQHEAIDVLLDSISLEAWGLRDEQKSIAEECAELCRFDRGMSCGEGNYHPLALTAFGTYLFTVFTCGLSHRLQIPDQYNMDYVNQNCVHENRLHTFTQCFDTWDPKYLRIYMLLTYHAPQFELTGNIDYFGNVLKWLAEVSTPRDHRYMLDTIRELRKNKLIEGCGYDRNYFRDLLENDQLREMEEWMEKWGSVVGQNNIPVVTRSIVDAIRVEDCKLIRRLNLTNCACPNLRSITLRNNESLTEVVGLNGLVALEKLHLEEMSRVKQLPGIGSLTKLRQLTLRRMPNWKERPDLSNCLHLNMENICISECGGE